MKGKTLMALGEDAFLRRLLPQLPLTEGVVAGAGDDCAVVRGPRRGELLILKTDAVVEGAHFTADTPPRLVGRKALARVLSDAAAMGGKPEHALVTLGAPPETPVAWVDAFYAGLIALAKRHGVSVAGGETTRAAQRWVSVSLTGVVPARRWAARGGGRAGDVLLVTGRLGGSLAGWHLRFEPRVAEGQWLAAQAPVHAMMDLSDGLAKDLPRLASLAGLEFEVDPVCLPRRRGCSVAQAWSDGEDYELLMAVPARAVPALLRKWKQRFPQLPLTPIGRLVKPGEGKPMPAGGWDAFR